MSNSVHTVALRKSLREHGDELNRLLDATASNADGLPTASQQRHIDRAKSELATIASNLATAEARDERTAMIDAARAQIPGIGGAVDGTYRRGGPSFFADLARSVSGAPTDAHRRLAAYGEEQRANSRTDGAGGEFVPPAWLIDQYVPLARPARAFADTMTALDLPGGTDQINIPKITGGSSVGFMGSDNSAVSSTDLETSSVASPVLTLAGQVDVSLQTIEQSPIDFDQIVFQDLMAQLNVTLDSALIGGAGTAGVPTGVFNQSGIENVTYTSASPTLAELYSALANAISQVNTARFLPPEVIVMHPRRWAWILTQVDTAGRPMVVPNAGGPFNAAGVTSQVAAQNVVGSMLGLPVVVDPSIPTTAETGALTGGTEDIIVVGRTSDAWLWEGPLTTRAIPGVLSGTLTVRLQVYKYVASTFARYPQSFAVISGTGLSAPTF